MSDWGYAEHNGPSTWLDKYPEACGSSQSPIDFETGGALSAPELKDRPLLWNYDSQVCRSIRNTGCGWRVDVDPSDDSVLTGGPLDNRYELIQFHCHWGKTPDHGSEHTVDGKPYVGELHFVHWNKDVYEKCADAVSVAKGLAVIGVFLEIGEANAEVNKLCQAIEHISFQDEAVDLSNGFDLSSLYPDNSSYWTYEGSLTTPPCYESVTWIVFKTPITVSEEQLEIFRSMHSHGQGDAADADSCCCLVRTNFRPAQPLNDRPVRDFSCS